MKARILNLLHLTLRDEEGQSIVEYFAIIAFLAVMIASVFMWTENSLVCAVSHSCSSVTRELDRINIAAHKGQIPK